MWKVLTGKWCDWKLHLSHLNHLFNSSARIYIFKLEWSPFVIFTQQFSLKLYQSSSVKTISLFTPSIALVIIKCVSRTLRSVQITQAALKWQLMTARFASKPPTTGVCSNKSHQFHFFNSHHLHLSVKSWSSTLSRSSAWRHYVRRCVTYANSPLTNSLPWSSSMKMVRCYNANCFIDPTTNQGKFLRMIALWMKKQFAAEKAALNYVHCYLISCLPNCSSCFFRSFSIPARFSLLPPLFIAYL